jgi:hypothetical protein
MTTMKKMMTSDTGALPMFKIRKQDGKWCLYSLTHAVPKPHFSCPLNQQFNTWDQAVYGMYWTYALEKFRVRKILESAGSINMLPFQRATMARIYE